MDEIQIDEERDIITLFGVKYSLELFRGLGIGGHPPGTYIEIVNRDDGVVTLRKHMPDRT